jgi:hypothetical protein
MVPAMNRKGASSGAPFLFCAHPGAMVETCSSAALEVFIVSHANE